MSPRLASFSLSLAPSQFCVSSRSGPTRTELFVDEAQYWSWSLTPAFGYFAKPPLIAWIIAASTSVCGHDEVCVRLPSVLLHAATGFLVFLIGRKLYSDKCGLIAAVAYATLPGVSLSAGIISTDVPLLFAWALALLAFVHLDQRADVDDGWPAGLCPRISASTPNTPWPTSSCARRSISSPYPSGGRR